MAGVVLLAADLNYTQSLPLALTGMFKGMCTHSDMITTYMSLLT